MRESFDPFDIFIAFFRIYFGLSVFFYLVCMCNNRAHLFLRKLNIYFRLSIELSAYLTLFVVIQIGLQQILKPLPDYQFYSSPMDRMTTIKEMFSMIISFAFTTYSSFLIIVDMRKRYEQAVKDYEYQQSIKVVNFQ